jgi:DNA polymerase-3 subunit gamma/tau
MTNPEKSFRTKSLRASRFSDVVGNPSVVKRVTNMIANDRVPPILFFTGPVGGGKTTLARIVASRVLCQSKPNNSYEPCGICQNCQNINASADAFFDYQEFSGGNLDDVWVDELKHLIMRKGSVIFVDELQDASPKHIASMRKVIEEDHPALLIFATTHKHEIEDAFLNRIKTYEFEMKRPSVDEVANYLEKKFNELNASFKNREQLIRVARALNSEMRPCAEFPYKVLAEANGILTDEFLDDLFGPQMSQMGQSRSKTRSMKRNI